MISFDELDPEFVTQLIGAIMNGLKESQRQAILGGLPVGRGHPATVTTGAEPNGTLLVAPDADPNAAAPPPVACKNTYGARIDVNERVLFTTAPDGSRTVSELLGGDIGGPPSVGTLRLSFNQAEPGHLLLGNGAQYSKALYPRLWAWIQGAPAAVKALFVDVDAFTFAMANLAGRVFVVAGAGFGLTARGLGTAGGGQDAVAVSHVHDIFPAAGGAGAGIVLGAGHGAAAGGYIAASGGSATDGRMPPWVGINVWIKY